MVAGIRQNFTKSFFKPNAVQRGKDRATQRVLSRFGAFVRTSARSSIRTRKKISAPGTPPHSHAGQLKRLMFFGYDRARRSVVVGPLRFRSRTRDVPRLLEEGGARRSRKRKIRVRRPPTRDAQGRFRTAGSEEIEVGGFQKYRKRPYMGPALKRNLPQLPSMWRNSVIR